MEKNETSTDASPVVTPTLVVPASAGPVAGTAESFTPDVLAKLQELEERSARHEKNLRPKNTSDSYAADWKQWEQFCALLELPVTAITSGSLTAFVEWLWWQPGWKKGTYTAPSTIDRRLSGVVVTGRTDHHLVLDKTVAARARRVLKAKVKEMEKSEEIRGRGPAPALLAELSFRPTGHSPRRGLATSSKRAGNDRKVIAKQGGWVDNSAAMEGYFEDGDGWEENALVKVL
ncbi:hypothetical protein ACFY20_35690 [Streptomyces sp. NPDC001312]|uniref:hypothetical protein n=1 Tax=Streptomyces sp. NPDC001312 TaxID=3364561 RepID=UPI0036AF16C2